MMRGLSGPTLRAAFEEADKNNDGVLSEDEFRVVLGCVCNLSDAEVLHLMHIFSNDQGRIEYPEFVTLVAASST